MYKQLAAIGVTIVSGCFQPQTQPSAEHSTDLTTKYLELATNAQEENDLVTVAWLTDSDDSDLLLTVFLESDIAALVEGSVRYSVEVRRRDADKAKTILRNDARLGTLSITIEP